MKSSEQGLLCLLVPCYALYYILSRWEDTKGAFVLMLLPAGNLVVVAAVAFSLGFVNGYERVQKATQARESRGGEASTGPAPAQQVRKANRDRVRQAEESFKPQVSPEYIESVPRLPAPTPGGVAALVHRLTTLSRNFLPTLMR